MRIPLLFSLVASRSCAASPTGQSLCGTWQDRELREQRLRPYVMRLQGGAEVYSELEKVCGSTPPSGDVAAYQAVYEVLQKSRELAPQGQGPQRSPLDSAHFAQQASEVLEAAALRTSKAGRGRFLDYGCGRGEMLSILHRRHGFASEDLHCIELYDSVPAERRGDFKLHLLQQPEVDLAVLAHGELRGSFDVVSAFSVFHHIPDLAIRAGALSGIYDFTRPGGIFWLTDWDSQGLAPVAAWYDAAHFLLWLQMGSPAPTSDAALELGTRYESTAEHRRLAGLAGFAAAAPVVKDPSSPVGGFGQAFRKPSKIQGSRLRAGAAVSARAAPTKTKRLRVGTYGSLAEPPEEGWQTPRVLKRAHALQAWQD